MLLSGDVVYMFYRVGVSPHPVSIFSIFVLFCVVRTLLVRLQSIVFRISSSPFLARMSRPCSISG